MNDNDQPVKDNDQPVNDDVQPRPMRRATIPLRFRDFCNARINRNVDV